MTHTDRPPPDLDEAIQRGAAAVGPPAPSDTADAARRAAAARRARVCRRRKRRKRRPTMVTVAFDSARAQRALVACGRLSEQEASDPKELLGAIRTHIDRPNIDRVIQQGITAVVERQ